MSTLNWRSGVIGLIVTGLAGVAEADVLLIPDSGNDRVWAFDPSDGSLLDRNFIPAQGNMIQPINAVDSGTGTILVSDENADAVFEYDYDGVFVGTVVSGVDALQGLTIFNNQVYVCSRSAAAVYRANLDGSGLETWADAGLGTPRDLVFRAADALITNSTDENIERFDLAGDFVETFHDSDGVTGIDFPQQLQLRPDGGVIVAGFSAPFGLYVYDASGNEVAAYTNIITSPRGVYELDNGQILYAGGTRVMRYDPATMTEETVINESGTSFRYIERSAAPTPCPADVNGDNHVDFQDLLALLGAWGPCPACPEDIDGNGAVDFGDILEVLTAWGPCPKKE